MIRNTIHPPTVWKEDKVYALDTCTSTLMVGHCLPTYPQPTPPTPLFRVKLWIRAYGRIIRTLRYQALYWLSATIPQANTTTAQLPKLPPLPQTNKQLPLADIYTYYQYAVPTSQVSAYEYTYVGAYLMTLQKSHRTFRVGFPLKQVTSLNQHMIHTQLSLTQVLGSLQINLVP